MAVMTVTGEIPASALGRTLTHEHLLADRKRITGQQDHVVLDEALAISELQSFASHGGRSLIDLTVDDFGRDPLALRRISQATGVQIVMGAGWYHERYYPERIDSSSVRDLAAALVGELREGVGDPGIRPGIIGEIGSGEIGRWITAKEERVLRACGLAQQEAGCPVSTHAFGWPIGLQQLSILEEAGADPAKVIVGHADSVHDPDYHEAIVRRGAWVQFDLLRQRADWDIDRQVALVAELARRGLDGRLLLSHDVCARSHLKAYGGVGYTGIWDVYLERFEAAGLPVDVIDRITDEHPATVFAD